MAVEAQGMTKEPENYGGLFISQIRLCHRYPARQLCYSRFPTIRDRYPGNFNLLEITPASALRVYSTRHYALPLLAWSGKHQRCFNSARICVRHRSQHNEPPLRRKEHGSQAHARRRNKQCSYISPSPDPTRPQLTPHPRLTTGSPPSMSNSPVSTPSFQPTKPS